MLKEGQLFVDTVYTCSCSVCGRRRTVIEEELEMLYDAYYEELQHYESVDHHHHHHGNVPHASGIIRLNIWGGKRRGDRKEYKMIKKK